MSKFTAVLISILVCAFLIPSPVCSAQSYQTSSLPDKLIISNAIVEDPDNFRKLKRVIIMGGSIKRGYGDLGFGPPQPPQPEWNILNDIPSAQKLFAAGVPLFVMPLDVTQLKLDEVKRAFLFSQGTPLTDALTLLYQQSRQQTPTLFAPITIASLSNPALCPVQPMHIRVDGAESGIDEEGDRHGVEESGRLLAPLVVEKSEGV